ncbi:MAG: Crp/Fnr family transcriptional regulator [Chloroflexota bacterium]|jgi:CRP/FNR family transcriptional regulator, cyclic AMP receptor protein
MTLTQDRRAELISSCRLFHDLDTDDLQAIADVAVEVDFPPGRPIVRQGEIGTGFFVIVDGRVRVARDGVPVAELGRGEFFGELSVIDGAPRNAQVNAIEATRCLAIASWDFERVLRENPGVALTVLRVVVARLRAADHDDRH